MSSTLSGFHYEENKIGGTFKSSTIEYIWEFIIDGTIPNKIQLIDSKWTGKKRLFKNGVEVFDKKNDGSFLKNFEIDDHIFSIIYYGDKCELRIDNQSFSHLSNLEKNKNYFNGEEARTSKTQVIEGFNASEKNGTNLFKLKDKEEKDGTQRTISIKEYYQMQYKIIFKYDDQPLFIEDNRNEKSSKIKYLIPELLYLTGNDDFDMKEKEDFYLMARKQFTPAEKLKKLKKGINYLIKDEKKKIIKNGENVELPSPNNIREEWGICFADNFLELKAAMLPRPLIKFADQDYEEVKVINGKFKIKKVLNPVNFDENNCLLITFKNLVTIAKNDCEQITKSAQAFGLEFSLPKLYILENTTKNELIQELEKIDFNNGKKMAMIVLDDNTRNLYPIIKDYIYSQAGVASQCMLHDEKTRPNINKFTMSYYSSILNQMVVKAQGELFEIKFCEELSKELTMIIGIEFSRAKDKVKYNISASYNKSLSKFYNDSKSGNIKDNTIESLLFLIKNALDYFESKNSKKLPSTIIIYREGTNDSYNDKILKTEIFELEQFFEGSDVSYRKDYKPKLTIFNVNKKTNLKFYQKIESNYKSVPIGCCIDDQVTMPEIFEFYLQSMEFEKGTAIPVQYLCVFNNNDDITMTDFEKITFNQSYYRWNSCGPTRIPVALINAEEANRYCNKYLSHDVLPCLKNSPYFI